MIARVLTLVFNACLASATAFGRRQGTRVSLTDNAGRVSCGGHYAASCAACPQGHGAGWCNGDCAWDIASNGCGLASSTGDGGQGAALVKRLIQHYAFQPVRTNTGKLVSDIVLVRSPFRGADDRALYERHKHEILFLGISSFEDYPLPSGNPFSSPFKAAEYAGLFPGWLHMFRPDRAARVFPPHVKLLLMSQSDFALPDYPPRAPSDARDYDFTYSGSDQDVANDCVGWSSYAKNWTLVKDALHVMCGEFRLRGVLVATKDKQGVRACTIPDSCRGLVLQTSFLDQSKYLDYVRRSRFQFLPQVHDASPRTATQALALDVPVLMNAHISGGWKYVTESARDGGKEGGADTGEFFHDMTDLRQALSTVLRRSKLSEYGNGGRGGRRHEQPYAPRRWIHEHYGDTHAAPRLLRFVLEHFAHRVRLPKGTTGLFPSGA